MNPFGQDFAVKPDGTPYRFAITYLTLAIDALVNWDGVYSSYIERAGGEAFTFDPNADVQKQIDFVDDVIAAKRADAIIIHAVNETMLAPVIDKAMANGIDCYPFDVAIYAANYVSYVHHDFDSDTGVDGSNVCGQYMVELAHRYDKPIYVFELWGDHAYDTSIERHNGFHAGIAGDPMVTVLESADFYWGEELAANLTMDAFTAYPELNGLFCHGGGVAGAIRGLDTIGRLLPFDDPQHVFVSNNDSDATVAAAMAAGTLDACTTHGRGDLADIMAKIALTHTVAGAPVLKDIPVPMLLITSDNFDTLQIWGWPDAYARFPQGKYDLWPPMNTEVFGVSCKLYGPDFGVPYPNKEMRLEYAGY